jgi:hypothetical protein
MRDPLKPRLSDHVTWLRDDRMRLLSPEITYTMTAPPSRNPVNILDNLTQLAKTIDPRAREEMFCGNWEVFKDVCERSMGYPVERSGPATLAGIRIREDDTLPSNVVEMRDGSGKLIERWTIR